MKKTQFWFTIPKNEDTLQLLYQRLKPNNLIQSFILRHDISKNDDHFHVFIDFGTKTVHPSAVSVLFDIDINEIINVTCERSLISYFFSFCNEEKTNLIYYNGFNYVKYKIESTPFIWSDKF